MSHFLMRQMRLEEGAHIEPLPPAVQNQAAGLPLRLLAAVAEGQLVAEAEAAGEDILVMLVQHSSIVAR
ncbi:MAG TPA: hypothetical protein VGW37_11810 [Terriglobia bacterium]|nr:hypothetical protein [Terriglobia bacterium]